MIRTFRHKGLKEAFRDGRSAKVPSELLDRILRLLDALDTAAVPEEMNLPGYEFHSLKGQQKDRYAVSVNGPWRITFGWDQADAIAVDLEQYH